MEKIQRTIRLSEQDLQAIAAIREQYGLTSDSEAIRFALQLVSKGKRSPLTPTPKKERRSHPAP
jgi:Arc/MetJ-type ribon-helix-helix transcriptional regulator